MVFVAVVLTRKYMYSTKKKYIPQVGAKIIFCTVQWSLLQWAHILDSVLYSDQYTLQRSLFLETHILDSALYSVKWSLFLEAHILDYGQYSGLFSWGLIFWNLTICTVQCTWSLLLRGSYSGLCTVQLSLLFFFIFWTLKKVYSSVAEPEPVEPKFFETWSRSRNDLFNKYLPHSVWRMLG